MTSIRVSLAGLPEAGKSTYIVALWAYLGASPDDNSYKMTGYPGQLEYLKKLADAWFAGQPLDRNTLGAIKDIRISLESPIRTTVEVAVPDLPGEAFQQTVTSRRIDETIASVVTECDLLFFFVNANDARTFHPVAELPPSKDNTHNKAVPFDVAELDSDLLNADLLQQLRFVLRDRRLPAISVLISAWDLCVPTKMSPSAWLCDAQPMFFQLLEELRRRTDVAVFGVSAQGDDYLANPRVVESPPLKRVYLVNDNGVRTNDLTTPLAWYEGLEGRA